MAFDFWALANDKSFQQEAVNELNEMSFKNFTQDGEYEVVISEAAQKLTRAGDAQISMRVKATTGESGWWNLLVGHGGGTTTTAKIAQQQLALIVKAAGRAVRDHSQLNGVRLVVRVTMKEGDDGKMWANFRCIGSAGQVAAPAAPVKQVVTKATPKAVEPEPIEEDNEDDIPF